MKRLPWAKFTIFSTPKMIVSPAEISQRYIASDRPINPWKAKFSIASGQGGAAGRPPRLGLLGYRNRRKRRLPVVVLGLEDLEVAEHRDRVLGIHHRPAGGNVVDELLVFGPERSN